MQTITITRKAALLLGMGFIATVAIVGAGSAWAGHQFADVPDNHTHHAGISYLKDTGITAGCGDGTNYCPDDFVKRSQMATFLHRASGNSSVPASVNAAKLDGEAGSSIRSRIAALENKLAAVTYDAGAKLMRISGANLQIVSGSGSTYGAVNGLGNLIVGYNESSNPARPRTGSHNLVVGPFHSYSSYGGLVAGWENTISGALASVTGGSHNTASGTYASVTGGVANNATAQHASVTGGNQNTASEMWASVSGGLRNVSNGFYASVSGGELGVASGQSSSITGGSSNRANYTYTSVAGGSQNVAGCNAQNVCAASVTVTGGNLNTAFGAHSVITGGQSNRASGDYASVTGGASNSALGWWSTVSGGANRSTTGESDWRAGNLSEPD